jgi:RepB DNA-primase from phage plasmid
MSAAEPLRDEDARSWRAKFVAADQKTLKARAWNADLLAAFRAARAHYAKTCGPKLREAYGPEWLKVITQAFEVYAALLDAAQDDEDETRRTALNHRFPLSAWRAQTYLSRKSLPFIADEEEFGRVRENLRRAWSRYGWRWVHKLQCVTGDALFECDTPDFKANASRDSAHYVDHLNDLLTETIRLAREARGGRRVNRFEAAFADALRDFKRSGRVPAFAVKWEPPPKVDKADESATAALRLYRSAPEMFCLAVVTAEEAQRPAVRAREVLRRAVLRSLAMLGDDAEARDALQIEAHALVDEIFEGERPAPYVPPCDEVRDSENLSENGPRESPPVESENHQFSGEIESPLRTFLTYGTPAGETLEFEPEAEPRGVSMADADAALTACASVGIDRLLAVFLDDTIEDFEESCALAEYCDPRQFRARLETFLKRNAAKRESLSVRFRFKDDFRFIQCDDCPPAALEALAPFSFLQLATSPGNGQSELALAEELDEEAYRVLKFRLFNSGPLAKLGVNAGGNGSMRWPGSENHKPKRRYADGAAPRVQLLSARLGRLVAVAELEEAGLLGPPPPRPKAADVRAMRGRLPKGWPSIAECYARFGKDRSRAEMVWCIKSLSRGWPESHVETELQRVGDKASVRRDGYARTTVEKAAGWLGLHSPRRDSDVIVEETIA